MVPSCKVAFDSAMHWIGVDSLTGEQSSEIHEKARIYASIEGLTNFDSSPPDILFQFYEKAFMHVFSFQKPETEASRRMKRIIDDYVKRHRFTVKIPKQHINQLTQRQLVKLIQIEKSVIKVFSAAGIPVTPEIIRSCFAAACRMSGMNVSTTNICAADPFNAARAARIMILRRNEL